jgi:hypothetical protein
MLLRALLPLLFATSLFAQRAQLDTIDARRDLPYAGTDNPKRENRTTGGNRVNRDRGTWLN